MEGRSFRRVRVDEAQTPGSHLTPCFTRPAWGVLGVTSVSAPFGLDGELREATAAGSAEYREEDFR